MDTERAPSNIIWTLFDYIFFRIKRALFILFKMFGGVRVMPPVPTPHAPGSYAPCPGSYAPARFNYILQVILKMNRKIVAVFQLNDRNTCGNLGGLE